jgi:cytochrome c oxidase assembly protein subunit 15
MKLNLYQRTAITTVIAVVFLIFIGGLVRVTGAGMGCPDWPKCFGEWIPPTDVSELPADYKSVFVEQRIEKNEKIVGYLNTLGFTELAETIENDPNVRKEEEFNAVKTWTEYVNRLIGAIIGILVFATFLTSLRYRKTDIVIPLVSLAAVLLTGFQGWLGSIVVSTNLLPGTISVHMVFAIIIMTVLLYGAYRATSEHINVEVKDKIRKKLYWGSIAMLILTVAQMLLGIQVREAIDTVKLAGDIERSFWVENSGTIFIIHRSFSWIVLIAGGYLMSLVWRNQIEGTVKKLVKANLGIILLQVFVGVGLEYLSLAPALQVIHLVGIALMICVQFLLILMLKSEPKVENS